VSPQFRIIRLQDLAQAESLLALGYEEAASTSKQHPLEINWRAYQRLADTGTLCIGGCFNPELVGFVGMVKLPDLWGLNGYVADVAAVYLHPDHRKGLTGYKLIRYAEKIARAMDCLELKFSVSRRSKSHLSKPRANLFANLGYTFREAVFVKRVQDGQ
jgi:GNAT superfamily N-acetyltransferase